MEDFVSDALLPLHHGHMIIKLINVPIHLLITQTNLISISISLSIHIFYMECILRYIYCGLMVN